MKLTTVFIAAAAGLASAKTITIESGSGGLVFKPDDIKADVGDILEFQFLPLNHSVAQGSLARPCEPLAQNGFFSGYYPVTTGKAASVFRVLVNDTNPIYFYCTQPTRKHCSAGMVGVVNPSITGTLAAYKLAAAAYTGAPGEPVSIYGGQVAQGGSSSGSSTVSSASGTATPTVSGSATSSSAAPAATSSRAAAGTMAAGMGGVLGGFAVAFFGLV